LHLRLGMRSAMPLVLFAGFLVAPLTACMPGHQTRAGSEQLVRRVEHDTGCRDGRRYTWTELDKRTIGVEACGKRAVYVSTCQSCADVTGVSYPCDCTWTRDASLGDVDMAAAPRP
jgi:hypothetical protein